MKEKDYLKELVEAKVLPAETKVTDYTHAEFKKMYDDHRALEEGKGDEKKKEEETKEPTQNPPEKKSEEPDANPNSTDVEKKLEDSPGPRAIVNTEQAIERGIQVFGAKINPWRVLCKAVGETFMTSTKALDLPGHNVLIESVREVYNEEGEIVAVTNSLITTTGRLIESEEKDVWKIIQ